MASAPSFAEEKHDYSPVVTFSADSLGDLPDPSADEEFKIPSTDPEVNPVIRTGQKAEAITVKIALHRAEQFHPDLQSRRLQQELSDITYENSWAAMFLPKISVTSTTSAAYTAGQLSGSAADLAGKGVFDHGAPKSGIAMSLGEYTLYNFGRDRDAYQSATLEHERSLQTLREVERQVRFTVIQDVLTLKTKQDLLDVTHRSVETAQAVYSLIKSKVALGKANPSDLASAEIDLLTARSALNQALIDYTSILWQVNFDLGDSIGHAYVVKSGIRYLKLTTPLEEAVRLFRENAPAIKDAKKSLEQSRIDLRILEKANLPLPTITFSGVTVGYEVGNAGTSPVRTTTGTTSGNLNISASVNLTMPLTGDGGFLNARARRAKEVSVELAEISLRKAANEGEGKVRTQYARIKQTEQIIDNNEKVLREAQIVFESSLKALKAQGTVNRLDLKDAIQKLRDAEQGFLQSVLDHYGQKVALAQAIGVNQFREKSL